MVAIMYVSRIKSKRGRKVYEQILLRESYREKGAPRSQVKHRTLLNLTHCAPEEIAAIEWGLKHKGDLATLKATSRGEVSLKQGKSAGAVWLLSQVAKRVGVDQALGRSRSGRLALWMVLARVIDQGSRLSAVRLAREHTACEVLGLGGFSEDDLYQAMDWIDDRQAKIEKSLFKKRHAHGPPQLFLYDVTSSYLEGDQNAFGAYGYSRDKKRGKLQIVVGLLTDPDGVPISVEVFKGNTQDPKTVLCQLEKLSGRFGVKEVTLVGDRGMIKSAQIEALQSAPFHFHYLSAITKPQIESLVRKGVFQYSMFDEKVCEVKADGVRYVLRRNPVRAEEIARSREDKFQSLRRVAAKKNAYLEEHPRARVEVALAHVLAYAEKLRVAGLVVAAANGREITVEVLAAALSQASRLDGCYALKTDVPEQLADAEKLHSRYKDLARVERAFRTIKTGHLEVRPVYVRNEAHTRAHVFIVMLAYLLRLELEAAWREFDLTVEEGVKQLSTLCATEVTIGDHGGYLNVPAPRDSLAPLFSTCGVTPPTTIPRAQAKVATKRKLPSRRKNV